MLLGHPWIHGVKGVASSLHQCFKFIHEDHIGVILADKIMENKEKGDIPILEIEHDDTDIFLNRFEVIPQARVNAIKYERETDIIGSKTTDYRGILNMMRKMNFMPGLGLSRNQ